MAKYFYKDNFYTIKELSDLSGIKCHTLRDRLRRGYSVEEAIKTIPTQDSVKEFCEASLWEDWVGMSMDDLHKIYWKWSIQHGYSALQKQGFSRQLMSIYPMLKTVPTKRDGRCYRIIRLK